MVTRRSLTSRDIALHAGVSQSTVSRALRGDPRVAAPTSERIVEVAERLGYTPNLAARSLITRRSSTVALVVTPITNSLPEIVDGLHEELSSAGYRMVLLEDRFDVQSIDKLPLIRGNAFDGVVLASATVDSPVAGQIADHGVPVVLLNRDARTTGGMHRVMADNRRGGGTVARYLAALGHTRIGVVTGSMRVSANRERAQGFGDGLRRRGVPLLPELTRHGQATHRSGYEQGLDLLGGLDRPTAVFCTSDLLAFGVLDAASRLGLPVPAAVSVVGYDDIEMAGWEAFSLTTIRVPLRDMARQAGRLLLEQLDGVGEGPGTRHVHAGDLVVRGTAGPPPGRRAARSGALRP